MTAPLPAQYAGTISRLCAELKISPDVHHKQNKARLELEAVDHWLFVQEEKARLESEPELTNETRKMQVDEDERF